MRPLRLLSLVVLILALTPSVAAAADIRQGQDITIATTETIEDDLYAFGTNVAINGTIHGDLIAAGNYITVDGSVTGDVIAAGQSVTIRGQVGGSVRAAGNMIVVDGKVANDLLAAGNEVTILSNGRVGRDGVIAATNTTVTGQIGRDLQVGGSNLKIDGAVGGRVVASIDKLQLTDRATVGGSLKYTSKNEAQIANASSVKGSIERQTPETGRAPLVTGPAALVVEWLKGLIGLLILGILVVFFFPGFSRRARTDRRRACDLLRPPLRDGRHDDRGRREPARGGGSGGLTGNRRADAVVSRMMKMRPKRVVVLAFAFLLAACSTQVAAPRPSESPVSTTTPTTTPRPTNAVNDVIYLRSVGSGGVANILAIDARTGATLRTFPDGSPSFDRSTLYAAEEKKGATQTVVRRMDFASARELSSFTIDGTYHAVWTDSGRTALSRDGRHLALSIYPYKLDGDWVTGFKVIDAGSGAIEATLDLKGQSTYSFVAISPDGRSLFLNQFGEATTGMRVFDVPSSTLLPATAIAGAVAQGGFRSPGVFSPDGRWMFSFDAGSQTTNCTSTDGPKCIPNGTPPYLFGLDLVSRRAVTVTVPVEQRSADFEKYLLWS
ncbi:MAG: DUF342 domain-containing protein, partial [Chloroflexi bacterium]